MVWALSECEHEYYHKITMNLLNLVKYASGSAGSAIGWVPQYFVRGVQLLDANGPRPFLRTNGRLRQTSIPQVTIIKDTLQDPCSPWLTCRHCQSRVAFPPPPPAHSTTPSQQLGRDGAGSS